MFQIFEPSRISRMKRAYTTRRVPTGAIAGLATEGLPCSGDLVVARVESIGQHKGLESPAGRRQILFPGDEILVCYGNRYAPSQFEAVVPKGLGGCDLVAAGGVASQALSWHDNLDFPTRIDVIGFATGHDGERINLSDHGVGRIARAGHRPTTIVIAGTAMDSGKTTTAAGIIRGLVAMGRTVGAAKSTGTGAGRDGWLMVDAGASKFLDFIDAGMASTYLIDERRIRDGFVTLNTMLANEGVDVSVIEIADGLYHAETRDLLMSDEVREHCDGIVFAAGDAAGAVHGVACLRELGLPVLAVSGLLTASPLAMREARAALDVPVLDMAQLWAAELDLVQAATSSPRGPALSPVATLAMARAS